MQMNGIKTSGACVSVGLCLPMFGRCIISARSKQVCAQNLKMAKQTRITSFGLIPRGRQLPTFSSLASRISKEINPTANRNGFLSFNSSVCQVFDTHLLRMHFNRNHAYALDLDSIKK